MKIIEKRIQAYLDNTEGMMKQNQAKDDFLNIYIKEYFKTNTREEIL